MTTNATTNPAPHRGFAAMPSTLLWSMAALLGIPGLYDVTTQLTTEPLEDVLFSLCSLAVGAFMLYCAVKAHQGKRAELEQRRIEVLGNVCLGMLVLTFVAKAGAGSLHLFG